MSGFKCLENEIHTMYVINISFYQNFGLRVQDYEDHFFQSSPQRFTLHEWGLVGGKNELCHFLVNHAIYMAIKNTISFSLPQQIPFANVGSDLHLHDHIQQNPTEKKEIITCIYSRSHSSIELSLFRLQLLNALKEIIYIWCTLFPYCYGWSNSFSRIAVFWSNTLINY